MVGLGGLVIAIIRLAHNQYIIAAPEGIFVYSFRVQEHIGVVAGRLVGGATVKIPDGQIGGLGRNEINSAVLAADVLPSTIDPDISGLDLTGHGEVKVLGDDGLVQSSVGRADEVVSSGSSGARARVAHDGAEIRADASVLGVRRAKWVGGRRATPPARSSTLAGVCFVLALGAHVQAKQPHSVPSGALLSPRHRSALSSHECGTIFRILFFFDLFHNFRNEVRG